MNQEQSLALFGQGRDAWNAWAENMLDARAALEAEGLWPKGGVYSEPLTAAAAKWFVQTASDFSGHQFDDAVVFAGFKFPGHTMFGGATFSGDACFSEATFSDEAFFGRATFLGGAEFDRATFSGDAHLDDATFSGAAEFVRATFSGRAKFGDATFSGEAMFGGATFSDEAWFSEATFSGEAWFSEATFSVYAEFGRATFSRAASFREATFTGGAGFGEATFMGIALFDEATFTGDTEFYKASFSRYTVFHKATFMGDAGFREVSFLDNARFSESLFSGDAVFNDATFSGDTGFRQSVFKANTNFADARFEKAADFYAIDCESAFSLAGVTFHSVPDFIQAHFKEAPRLDNTRIEPQRLWPVSLANVKVWFKGDADRAARWRALKRLAVEGHDHGQELSFFKAEIKARRWGEDKPWYALFWFGLFYQWFSDFGRSLVRPLLWWMAGVAGFAFLYMWLGALSVFAVACRIGPGEPWQAALGISIRKALLFLGQGSTTLNRFYACLYDVHQRSTLDISPGELPLRLIPKIPFEIVMAGVAQNLLSAIFIFLFLLAIRNHFRIK